MTDRVIAVTRAPTEALLRCRLTHLRREPIDFNVAAQQHRAYEDALRTLGAEVVSLPPEDALPDAVFVEDTALVLDEIAVMMHPGAKSRVPEVQTVARVLKRYRTLEYITPPGTMDGGDVLRVGRTLFVGYSSRTNREAIEQLTALGARHGYAVTPVRVTGCLHLKSACTHVGEGTLVANRDWIAPQAFASMRIIDVAEEEPGAANTFFVGETLVMADNYPKTRERLERAGHPVHPVALTELQKAEAGGSCMSLVFEEGHRTVS
jgi:dimethylargininase